MGKILPRYPVYVISKGRSDRCLTARFLVKDKVPFYLVVEPQEADLYAKEFDRKLLIVLPFSNLGLGGIPARNFVWEHAKASGTERHWILDDNIYDIKRRWKGTRLVCSSGPALAAVEDFTDRYENIGISGLAYSMFCPDGLRIKPFFLNVHVYSCLLIRNSLTQRWRGRYNEDTDLCLQVLSSGLCTVLVNCFMITKIATMTMKGGNATELYKGDGRLKMARSLERMWPGVVEVKRRFKRPQHVIKFTWKKFNTPLIPKPGTVKASKANEYGLKMVADGQIKSSRLRKLLKDAERNKSCKT